jgi:hypothetical protein
MKTILFTALTVLCLSGFSGLSYADEMGKMKAETTKGDMKEHKDAMKGEMKAGRDEMKGEKKAKQENMKGEMKEKHDDMKGEMKGQMGAMGK